MGYRSCQEAIVSGLGVDTSPGTTWRRHSLVPGGGRLWQFAKPVGEFFLLGQGCLLGAGVTGAVSTSQRGYARTRGRNGASTHIRFNALVHGNVHKLAPARIDALMSFGVTLQAVL